MFASTESATPDLSQPQVAVVPLNLIQVEDVGRSAARFDAWLRANSGDRVTLERIKTQAGALPTAGNIMALVDVLNGISGLCDNSRREPLDWVGLGINLIGILPAPPNMAAARMSLRPTLFLVRQTLSQSGKQVLGDSLIETIIGHLNADIVGTLDDFVTQAQARLPEIIDAAASLGTSVVNEIAIGLEGAGNAALDGKPFQYQAGVPVEAFLHDPKATISNIFAAVANACKAAGRGMASSGTPTLPAAQVRQRLLDTVAALRALATELHARITSLGNVEQPHSIGGLLQVLAQAVEAWRQRNDQGQGANVKPTTTSQARHMAGEGALEVRKDEVPADKRPNEEKNKVPCSTCRRISFAVGSESFDHTDFSLPGPFPLEWTRTYCSSLDAYDQEVLGARWITPFTTRFDRVGNRLAFHEADGREIDFPLLKVGATHYDPIEKLTLVRSGEEQLLLCRGFERQERYDRQGQSFQLASIVLRNGAALMLHYEHRHGERSVLSDLITCQGDMTQVHRHLGTLIDDHGRLTGLWEIVDGVPQRQLCAYQYDELGDLIQAQDENGEAWAYQYQHHLVTRYADRTGRGTNLQWQGTGAKARAIREWADDGSFETQLEWDPRIRLTRVTDALGNQTWHYCDALGYTYRIRYADGHSEWLFRDDAKNVVRHVHADGSVDRYRYDQRGNLLEHIRADESTVHYAFDDQDQLIKILDAEGGLWHRAYDDRGSLVEMLDPLGNKTQFIYKADGLMVAIKEANGSAKKLICNADGQLIEFVDCSGKKSCWAYDDRGQMICFTDAAGNSTEYQYRCASVVLIKHADKSEERFEHDAEGRLLAYADGIDRCTTWSYNAAGMIAERVDASEQTLRYRWDRLGQLLALENQNEAIARFQFDAMGRLREESGFDGRVTRYQYAPESGRLMCVINGEHRRSLRFDPLGRVIETVVSLAGRSQSETFAYDGNGNLVQASNADCRLQWFFDPVGNLTREHQHYLSLDRPTVAVWQHEYDSLNRRIATVRPDGHRVSWLTYGSGHLLALRLDEHDLISYERDDLHREIARHQGNQLLHTQQWDVLGRLQEQVLGRPGDRSTVLKRSYQYDAAGQLTDINDSRRGPIGYRYDPVERLVSATTRQGEEIFAFDPASNLLDNTANEIRRPLEQTPIRNKRADNVLRKQDGTHYAYDERGNLIQRVQEGNRSELQWDLFDRLVHFEDQRLTVEFAYDALGRRLYKKSDAHFKQHSQAGSQWNRSEHARAQREYHCGFTLYGWDGDNLAWESTPSQQDGGVGRTVHYVYEPGSFVPLVQAIRHSPIDLPAVPDYAGDYSFDEDPLWSRELLASAFDTVLWYQCDHLGTPQELTDAAGNLAWSAQYLAWGQIRQQRSEWAQQQGIQNPLRFQGQYHDHETGLHYNRFRYYDPVVGRFISPDPIGYVGGLNLYEYAPNPVVWIDPYGLMMRFFSRAQPFTRSVRFFSSAADLGSFTGKDIVQIQKMLKEAQFKLKNAANPANEDWIAPDGSQVKLHRCGDLNAKKPVPHAHKIDPAKKRLNDAGKPSDVPQENHIPINNPKLEENIAQHAAYRAGLAKKAGP